MSNQFNAQLTACNNTTDFFNSTCTTFFTTNPTTGLPTEKQVPNQAMDTVARSVCTQIAASSNPQLSQTNWCSCYNAPIPDNISPAERGIFQCLNSDCMSKGLRPFGMSCPSTLTICEQVDNSVDLKNSTTGALYLQNNCGNFCLNGVCPTQPPSTSPPGGTSSLTFSKDTLITVGASIGIVIAFIAIIIMVAKSGKKKVIPR